MTPKQREAIERHGNQIKEIFPNCYTTDPVKLCKRLQRIEARASKIGLALCNDSSYTDNQADDDTTNVLRQLTNLLGFEESKGIGVAIFVNRDPRGYALKIQDDYVREHNLEIHRDWGGFGILAPEIDSNGN